MDHTTSEHLRRHAVRRVVEDGELPSKAMRSMGLHRTSICRWLNAYAQDGDEALASSKASGPRQKLDEKQRRQVRRWILGRDPRQHGFDFGLWTRRIVAELIREKFGITLQLTAVGRLPFGHELRAEWLARLDITPQKPLRRAYERDPEAVEQWVRSECPKLRRRARKLGATIFSSMRLDSVPNPRRARPAGSKGALRSSGRRGKRQKVSAISAISAKGASGARSIRAC